MNKISELASSARKSRVSKLAAVHSRGNSAQRAGLLLKIIVRQGREIIRKQLCHLKNFLEIARSVGARLHRLRKKA